MGNGGFMPRLQRNFEGRKRLEASKSAASFARPLRVVDVLLTFAQLSLKSTAEPD
jgi:hypothetical protein